MIEDTQEVELNATNLPSRVYLNSNEVTTTDNNTYQSNKLKTCGNSQLLKVLAIPIIFYTIDNI